jgi:hypothetical protein
MATFGDTLAALDDYRANLVHEQLSAPIAEAHSMAFRSTASLARGGGGVVQNIHATGVGVRSDKETPGPDDFVIKLFVFEDADVQAARAAPGLTKSRDGVDVEVETLQSRPPISPSAPGPAPREGAAADGVAARRSPATRANTRRGDDRSPAASRSVRSAARTSARSVVLSAAGRAMAARSSP